MAVRACSSNLGTSIASFGRSFRPTGEALDAEIYVILHKFANGAGLPTRRVLVFDSASGGRWEKGEKAMFGSMNARKMIEVGRRCDLPAAVRALVGETQAQARIWIEFPSSLLVLMTMPGENDGALFLLDREPGVSYWLYFCGA